MIAKTLKVLTSFRNPALVVLLVLSSFFAWITPIGWDIRASIGSAFQARFSDGFPSVFGIWDHRGELYRLWLISIDWLASVFGLSIAEPVSYERFFNFLVLVLVGLCAYLVYFSLKSVVAREFSVSLSLLFAIVFINVSTAWVFASPDHIGSMIAVSGALFLLRNEKRMFFLAGFLAAATIGLKVTLILTGVSAILAALALSSKIGLELKSRFSFSLIGGIAAAGFYFVFLVVSPYGLSDFVSVLGYQGSLGATYPERLLRLIELIVDKNLHVPSILAIAISLLPLLAKNLFTLPKTRKQDGERLSVLFWAASVVFAFLPLLVQSQPFGYHLVALLPVIFLALVGIIMKDAGQVRKIFSGSFVTKSVATISLILVIYPFGLAQPSSHLEYWSQRISEQSSESELRDYVVSNCSGPVLYLSWGGAAYAIAQESYPRQTYPLDIQRKGDASLTPRREEAVNEALNFSGDCIYWHENWLNSSGRPWFSDIENKIKDEYIQSEEQNRVWMRRD